MAYIIQHTSGRIADGAHGWAARIADRWNRYRVYRRTYAELSALSSRELTDLGIGRSTISRLAHEAAYGK